MSSNSEKIACYRLYAANCVELAQSISDLDRRVFLLNMARDWLGLADQAEKSGTHEEDSEVPSFGPEPGPPTDHESYSK